MANFYFVKKNLFDMPQGYCFAHCISEDFKLGAGIAVEFISAGSGEEDYFHAEIATMPAAGSTPAYQYIKFTQKSNTTNPVADVKSTLVITLTDAFGCDQTYSLPFIVKRAQ